MNSEGDRIGWDAQRLQRVRFQIKVLENYSVGALLNGGAWLLTCCQATPLPRLSSLAPGSLIKIFVDFTSAENNPGARQHTCRQFIFLTAGPTAR